MRRAACSFTCIFLTLALTGAVLFQTAAAQNENGLPAVRLYEHMGSWHHPITTSNPDVQRWFDQGLTLAYGFNREAAAASFTHAIEIDPKAAMPLWGLAYALGPDLNVPFTHQNSKAGFQAIQRAIVVAKNNNAPEVERDYIAAMAERYSEAPYAQLDKLAQKYSTAMRALSKKYPDDIDAATLFAESMMDLHPWRMWENDGTPAPHTLETVEVLEGILRRSPMHPGANHFYVHAMEASPQPERALPSAMRLESLVPDAGHLVHMPAHIYDHVGDYESAARINIAAISADDRFAATGGSATLYYLMYTGHNMHFLAWASAFEGRNKDAYEAAKLLYAHVQPSLKQMPMVESWMAVPMQIQVYAHSWKAILAAPAPDQNLRILTAYWRFARGMALVAMGDLKSAQTERDTFQVEAAKIPPDAPWGLNSASQIMLIAGAILDGRIFEAQKNVNQAAGAYLRAVRVQDNLYYDEPAGWPPVREDLGAMLLRLQFFDQAEVNFRDELDRRPLSGRALFGLWQALKAQHKDVNAEWARRAYEEAWRRADAPLSLDDF